LKHPNSPLIPEANLQIAYIYLEQGKYPDAQKAFEKSIAFIEKDILRRTNYEYLTNLEEDAAYWKAIATYQQGRYLEAIPIFQELVQKHPQSKYADDALFGVGMIYERNREYDSAIIQFNIIENNYPYSNSVLASYIRSANNNIVQRTATRAFCELEYASNTYNHIQIKDSLGLLYEPQSYIQAPFEEINYLRGEAYNVVGNYTEAKSTFKAFLESYTVEHLRLYFVLGLGWASLNLGEYDEAMKYYEQVISMLGNLKKIFDI
jgi:TolA-binding protein